jgi:hypothetical protein
MSSSSPAKRLTPVLLACTVKLCTPVLCTAVLCTAVLCTCLSGCQLVGAIAEKARGPEKIPALYVPKKVPTLILCEHNAGANVDDLSAEDLGRRVAEFWEPLKLAPMVDLSKLDELRQEHPQAYYSMSTVALGKALRADQVLYIDVRDCHDESAGGSDTIRATASARVRMVDVATGQTLWPADAAGGYAVDSETQFQARGEGVSESTQMEQVRQMLANKIIKLFYEHVSDDDGTPQ